MNDDQTWAPLRQEIDRWQAAGRTARLWLRDDDVVEPTDVLERLLDVTRPPAIPLTLAAVPAFAGQALADRLKTEQHVLVAVHGWSHRNHAPPEEKKQELGGHRPRETVLGELRDGIAALRRLFPETLLPMLVPPWNRISADLIPELPGLGFTTLSTFGKAKADSGIRLLNTHVDVVNARGQRGNRPHQDLVAELVGELQTRFENGGEPVGILTHHLVHGASEWDFMARLFEETTGKPGIAWLPARELLT